MTNSQPRTVVLTGATSGIGLATARLLAERPGTLILHGPEPEHEVDERIGRIRAIADPDTAVRYFSADFTEPRAVIELAHGIRRIGAVDVLLNNAGIPGPVKRTLSPWGVELTFAVNFLASALLTDLVLPAMREDGRVVNVASATHESATLDLSDVSFARRPYSAVAAYAQSKLAIVANTARLASLVPQAVLSIHPGVISTGLLHAMFGAGGSSPEHAAGNLVSAISASAPSGSYLYERRVGQPNPSALDPNVQRRLHDLTTQILGRTIT